MSTSRSSPARRASPTAAWWRCACLAVREISRSEIDAYTEFVKIYGAKGLAWIKVNDVDKGREGLQSPVVKNLHDQALAEVVRRTGVAQRRPAVLRRRQGQGRQRRASARCA